MDVSSNATDGSALPTIPDPITRLVAESSSMQLVGHSLRALVDLRVVSGSPVDRLLGTTRNAGQVAWGVGGIVRTTIRRNLP